MLNVILIKLTYLSVFRINPPIYFLKYQ